jgi:glycosyl transferase family 87
MSKILTSPEDCTGEAKRRLPKVWLLVGAIMVLLWRASGLVGGAAAPVDDFIEYWSASRLLLAGKNPYSTEELTLLQRPLTGSETPLIMWNPPWALSLLLPFGLLEYSTSRWLWLILNLGLLLFSARWLWNCYVRWQGSPWLSTCATLLLAVTFLPGAVVLSLGQIGPVVLMGIVAFLSLVRREQYFKAGAMTLVIALKPHLLFLFWIFLLLWVLRTHRWVLVAGAALALIFGAGLPLFFYSDLISGYLSLVARESIFHHPSTTTGAFLRWMLGWEKVWLQVLPMVPGILWAAFYWRRHGRNWDWDARMPLVLLISVVTACYGWVFDQTILYPALFQAVGWLLRKGQWHERFLAAVSYVLINAVGFILIALGLNGIAYVWMAPTWLVFHRFAAELGSEGHGRRTGAQERGLQVPVR